MEKKRDNCRKSRCDAIAFTLCMDDPRHIERCYKDWKPDYQTLESQLQQERESHFMVEQHKSIIIDELQSQFSTANKINIDLLEEQNELIDKLRQERAEKEVLKEALRIACERFVFHMKDCPAEFGEDFMDVFKCHDICDQYPDKPFSCWKNYFLNQAQSKIEVVK
jgi:hypothetical protein